VKLRNCDLCTGEAGLGNGFIREVSLYQRWGTATERFIMRPLTSVLVVLILAVAPVTAASAQVGGTPNPNSLLAVPGPNLPDPNVQNIPAPLPAPSQSPIIDGPTSQPDLTPLSAAPPLMGAPLAPTAVPSVFQSQTGL
jgi:hypothetical protein